jgi:hypothetical protein
MGKIVLALFSGLLLQAHQIFETKTARPVGESDPVVVVASVGTTALGMGIRATNPNITRIYIDQELMDVMGVSDRTVRVRRGVAGTRAMPHASGAIVYAGPAKAFAR